MFGRNFAMDVELLRSLAADRYVARSVPGPRDDEIAELVGNVTSVEDFASLASGLDLASGRVLNNFAKRAASQAVRLANESWVRHGLIAALLSATVEDYREIARTNSLLFRAAELIDSEPVELFEEAAELATPDVANAFRIFAHADESARSISVMGYVEGADDDGFRFISEW
jgi:hypothetical protein